MRFVFRDGAVFFPSERLLCMADLHLGYEAELRARGVHVPAGEFADLTRRIERLLDETKPRIVVLNGDVKHGIGTISDSEWRHIRLLIEVIRRNSELVIVTGNHDVMLGPITKVAGVATTAQYVDGEAAFLHGDALPEDLPAEVRVVVVGHEHPAVRVADGARTELVKCYLVGAWEGRRLIVLPSMFSLTVGSDVLSVPTHSPFLRDIAQFSVYVQGEDEVLFFGKVKDLR